MFFPAQETPILEASDVLNMYEIHDGLKGMAKPWNADRTASPFHDTARMFLSNCQEDEADFCGSRSNSWKAQVLKHGASTLLSQVTVSFSESFITARSSICCTLSARKICGGTPGINLPQDAGSREAVTRWGNGT